ncbi:hypothetical protein TNCV_4703831 [Trichonephila clavipes]|nr:hypothetical protein TNCV_4703831 [Trichonephila clavipes]
MLKEKLSGKPVLHAPNFSKSFILQTDASDQGYGGVLTQKDDNGKEHPILFLSRREQLESVSSTRERSVDICSRLLPLDERLFSSISEQRGKSRAEYMRKYRQKKREERLKTGGVQPKKIARNSTQRSRDFRARVANQFSHEHQQLT